MSYFEALVGCTIWTISSHVTFFIALNETKLENVNKLNIITKIQPCGKHYFHHLLEGTRVTYGLLRHTV